MLNSLLQYWSNMWSGDFKAADWEEACPSVVPETQLDKSVLILLPSFPALPQLLVPCLYEEVNSLLQTGVLNLV